MLAEVGHPTVVNPDRALRKEAAQRDSPVLTFTRPVPLRERIPAPSTAYPSTPASSRTAAALFSPPEADTTTTSRPHNRWSAMSSAASAKTSGSTMSWSVSVTTALTCSTSHPAHMLVT